MKTQIKNKKGIFGVMLVFATIVILITALISFNAAKNKISSEIDTPIRLTELNTIKNNFLVYSNNSVILASQHSYNAVFKEISGVVSSSCMTYLNSVVIKDDCLIDQNKLENKFLEKFNSEYLKLMNNYPQPIVGVDKENMQNYKISPKFETKIQGEKLFVESIGQKINISRQTKFMFYQYSLNINPITEINLTKEKIFLTEIRGLIAEINTKSKTCKLKAPDRDILSCFNEIESDYFTLSPSIGTSHILIEIKTKDKFFFDDSGIEKFDNLLFNVAISKA